MSHGPDPNTNVSGRFPSTHWSLIKKAGSHESPQARAALAELCSAYWYPIYAFIRRKGNGADQALDLTQGFLLVFWRKVSLRRPSRARADSACSCAPIVSISS